jgi:N-acetylmuramoyl-L-alanine amidase
MKIVINGGHYPGVDSGAVGASGLQEADVARSLMGKVANYIRVVGHEVLEIQENELYEITDASNNFGAELFISIHCNAAENREAKGTETFCYQLGSEGEELARCIQKQIVNSLGTVDRGIKTANFAVLRGTNCPAVLVETAFISNIDDETLLASEGAKDIFAKAIARGITDYI